MSIAKLARPELLGRSGYQAALGRFDLIRLHANESPQWDAAADEGLNRYPPPRPLELNTRLAEILNVNPEQLLVTRGSNEGIDLLVRTFCRSGVDQIITCPPTFGMYGICAQVQGAQELQIPLDDNYDLDSEAIIQAVSSEQIQPVKLVFICSPANPTGNTISWQRIDNVCTALAGRALVVLDQAYIEFTTDASVRQHLAKHDNLVVLRTFSKAYGLAGLRCGFVLAQCSVIELLDSILAPYSVPTPTIEGVLAALTPASLLTLNQRLSVIQREKSRVAAALLKLPTVDNIYPSASNFLLVRMQDADKIHAALKESGILVRNFSSSPRLSNCLRITIGSPTENDQLLSELQALCS